MKKQSFATATAGIAAALALLLGSLGASSASAQSAAVPAHNAVIFVHGAGGSAAQFEAQAQRFVSNGYDMGEVRVLEFDSSRAQQIMPEILSGIDALVAELQQQTGRAKVDLVGHSLGTLISQNYLATPERAASIEHYVNADGRAASALPGGVPTLALFAGAARAQQGEIVGGTNVTLADQLHVEAVASAEAFAEMFRFFTGTDAATTDVIATKDLTLQVGGRAVLFPQNTGAAGAMVSVFELDPTTGGRRKDRTGADAPAARVMIDATGNFGPVTVRSGVPLEFEVIRTGVRPASFFMEPPLRDDLLVRLNNVPDSAGDLATTADDNVNLTIVRNSEFRGDRAPDPDVLTINGENVINPVTTPCCAVGRAPVALDLNDVGLDRRTDLTTPVAQTTGFMSSADVFIPALPGGVVEIRFIPRGNNAAARTLLIPARPSSMFRTNVLLDVRE